MIFQYNMDFAWEEDIVYLHFDLENTFTAVLARSCNKMEFNSTNGLSIRL